MSRSRNVEKHLRTTFTYTLDLTDAKRIEGQDPMVAFLYDLKRGHCEYFAGAMTLMLQSLYMPARVVIGFRCDDYNSLAEWYHVSQNQAHAWVEARGGWNAADGPEQAGEWLTYDPTSGRESIVQRSATMMTRVRNAFEYLEHTWATSVIAYDRGSRDNLVQSIDTRMTCAAISSTMHMQNIPNFLRAENWAISIGLINILITLAIVALVGSIGWFLFERWRMWRRARASASNRCRAISGCIWRDNSDSTMIYCCSWNGAAFSGPCSLRRWNSLIRCPFCPRMSTTRFDG